MSGFPIKEVVRLSAVHLAPVLLVAALGVRAAAQLPEGPKEDSPPAVPAAPNLSAPGGRLSGLSPDQLGALYSMVRVGGTSQAEAEALLADAEAGLYLPATGEVLLLTTPERMGQAERRLKSDAEAEGSSPWSKAEELGLVTLPSFFDEMARSHADLLAGRSGLYLIKYPVRIPAPEALHEAVPGDVARGEAGGIVLQEGFESSPWSRWLRADSTGGLYTWDAIPCSPHGGGFSAYATAGGSVGSTLTCGTPYATAAYTSFADGQCENLQGASEAWVDLYFSLNLGAGSNGAVNFTFPQPSNPSWFTGYGFVGNMGTSWVHFIGNLRQWNGFDLATSSCSRLKVDFTSDAYPPSGFGARVDDITIQAQTPQGMSCGISADQTGGPAPFTINLIAQVQNPGQGLAFTWHFWPDQDTASTPVVTHTFTSPGRYIASLQAVGSSGNCEAAIPVTVGCLLDCAVTPSATFGPAPLAVTFASSVTPSYCAGSPAYAWTFGDGGTSTAPNPVHTYSAPGTYSWALAVTQAGVTCSQSGTVKACDFTCTATVPQTAAPGTQVSLQAVAASTLCPATASIDWDFGDGSAHAPGPSVTHVFASGVYNWTMTATLGGLSCTRTGTIAVCTLSCDAATSVTSGLAPLAVSFTGALTTSQGCPAAGAYDWDFGDGAPHSSLLSPSHTYSAPGTYAWTFSTVANGLTCVKTGSVTVCPLTCSATVPSSQTSGTPVAFQASAAFGSCSATPTYDWDFGDGSPHSPQQNPQHTYPGEGSYTWTLTVASGGASCTRTGSVTLCALACSAVPSVTMGTDPLAVTFTGSATLTAGCPGTVAYDWDFGDGSAHSSSRSPSHTYVLPGPHTWVLTATAGGLTCSKTGTVTVCALTCAATASATTGQAPLEVAFTGAASQPSGCPGTTVFDWNFGDGSLHSSDQSPRHSYAFAGAYSWTLTVTANGLTCSRTGSVQVCDLVCGASASTQAGFAPLAVSFTGSASPSSGCAGPVAFDWDFGDGSAHASSQSPVHTYAAPGVYSWTLRTSAPGLTCSQTGTVTVCSLTCQAASSVALGVVPLAVTFTGSATASSVACTGTPSLDWDFGDGSAHGTGSTAFHSYTQPGTYQWTLKGTLPGATCTKMGSVTVYGCSLDCSASAAPGAGDPTTTFQFSALAATPDCQGAPTLDWDFGDGTPHSSSATPTHTYANGTSGTLVFTWTMRASLNGTTCTRTGQVLVTPLDPRPLQGYAGICSGSGFWPLNADGASGGVANLSVYATEDANPGNVVQAQVDGSHFVFAQLPPAPYTLYAEMDYLDNVNVDNNNLGDRGCQAPALGTGKGILKHVISPGTAPPGGSFAEVCFPAPLVMLHGDLDCYTKWYSASGDTTYWDNAARDGGPSGTPGAGFISFTPNYRWWGPGSSWEDRADQILGQLQADLTGLVGAPAQALAAGLPAPTTWPPYTVIAHDMGGLVARVLTAGRHRNDGLVKAMGDVYLLGTPNSGSDFLFGGANGPMGVQGIVRRFNALYPDFGDETRQVTALAGKQDWWGEGRSDGPVTLSSAFNITQVACATGQGGTACQPYPFVSFPSSPAAAHVFPFAHDQLGGPASVNTLLRGVILRAEIQSDRAMARPQPTGSGSPESPVGSTVWGTTARTTTTLGPDGGGLDVAEAVQSFSFTVGTTDGLAVLGSITSGAATFDVVNPSGQTVSTYYSAKSTFSYVTLDPPSGSWTLRVTPDSGGVRFTASVAEDSPFDGRGFILSDPVAAGSAVTFRLDLTGDTTGLTVSGASAQVYSGSTSLATVSLDPVAGSSGSYSGTWTTPANLASGAYPVIFSTQGTYGGSPSTTWSTDTVHILPATHLLTGSFSDAPVDLNGDGAFDAIQFSAQAAFPASGRFVLEGDLYDANGYFVDHATGSVVLASPGTAAVPLTFDLRGSYCPQFAQPFSVSSLTLADGDALQPVDAWPAVVSTASYSGGAFGCRQGSPTPRVAAIRPDQALQGQSPTVLVGGRRFRQGATVTFDSGIIVNQTALVNDRLLGAFVTVDPGAQPGPRSLTVTNPDGGSDTLLGGFLVAQDQPPTVAIQAPHDGVVLPDSGQVVVSAAATDDVKVTQVTFLLDGSIVSTDFQFPFAWKADATSIPHGIHTITARARDTKGQTADATITVVKSPPTIASLLGGGTPWKLKIGGTNFISGVTVTIGSDGAPWSKVTFKNSTLILLKGGTALRNRFPIGRAVPLLVRNPDGTSVTATYTRLK